MMKCFNQPKGRKLLAIALSIAMVFSIGGGLSFAETGGHETPSDREAAMQVSAGGDALLISNTSGVGKISMTATPQTVTVTFKLSNMSSDQEAIDTVTGGAFYLYRDKGSMPADIYPWQFLARGDATARGRLPEAAGGAPWKLQDWRVANTNGTLGALPLFSGFSQSVTRSGSVATVNYSFDVARLFNNAGANNFRTAFLDYTGDYKFEFRDPQGILQSRATVRLNPYDSYRTMPEIESEINQAAAWINDPANPSHMYAEVRSLGESEYGRNMPYIIIAKDKQVLSNYEDLMELEENDPAQLIRKLNSGYTNFQVPILYSNIHADEFNGVDSILNFMWDIAREDRIDYKTIRNMKPAGESQLAVERAAANVTYPQVFNTLPEGSKPKSLGYVRGATGNYNASSIAVNMNTYYNMQNTSMVVDDLLDDVFFILVPEENVDGRTLSAREGYGGVDLNRDNLFQTQKETQNMTKMIAAWNPIIFWEQHGFVSDFQIEPCTPPHEANFEYDLLARHLIGAGEAYGNGAISNNPTYNSYRMPFRDYFRNGRWEVWDDVSTAYTPEYAMLHGTIAYTVEVPSANEEANTALEYGLINNAKYTADNKVDMLRNQALGYERGIHNIDADAVDPWFENISGTPGAEADVFRPRYSENDNYFPEYYVIPADGAGQRNLSASKDMTRWLLDNDVKLTTLNSDVTVTDAEGVSRKLSAGSVVVDMHQAKRNVANVALSNGLKLKDWGTSLYSEPVTAFPEMRGFTSYVITKADALSGKLSPLTAPEEISATKIRTPYTIVLNGSVETVKAINGLLNDGEQVGFIQNGEYKGHFILATDVYETIRNQYDLTALPSAVNQDAKRLRKGTIYLPGLPAEFAGTAPNFFGASEKTRVSSSSYEFNYSNRALKMEMGFDVAYEYSADADVVVGNASLSTSPLLSDIESGDLAYLGWGSNALSTANTLFNASHLSIGAITSTNTIGNADALYRTEYVADSPITAAKRYFGDDITYNYGCGYMTSIPSRAAILQQVTGDDILAGSMPSTRYAGFMGSIQGLQYKENGVNIVVYTHSLVRKNHQKDDYLLASSAIFDALTTQETFDPDVSEFQRPGDYTISFSSEGTVISTVKRDQGEAYGVLPWPVREGYVLEGWFTASSGGTRIYETSVFSAGANQTLYAHWSAIPKPPEDDKYYTVSFDGNSGNPIPYTIFVLKGKAYGVLPTATRTGYTFAGWYTAPEGGEKIIETTIFTADHNQTLYAHWTVTTGQLDTGKTYKVVFNSNGGKAISFKLSVKYGAAYGKLPAPTRTGYTFKGWYTTRTGGTKVLATTRYTKEGNRVLFARWTAKKYRVLFKASGAGADGKTKVMSGAYVYGKKFGKLPAVTRAGYTFTGWYTKAKGGTKITASKVNKYAKALTLYAHWKKK